jgi:hypothetical protein
MNPRSIALALALALGATLNLVAADSPAPAQKSGEWQSLFDGHSFAGWRGYQLKGPPAQGWEIKDGLLKTVAKVKGVALITEGKFTDFELVWEWRIAEAGNNGVKYFVTEARPKSPGHEYQMLDDARHPDGRIGPHRQTAALYDLFPPAADKPSRPAGEWNTSRIIVRGNQVEHWLNGRTVLTYDLGSAAFKAALAKSKFAHDAGFGEKVTGPIMLTYHQDECWYRSIRIRELR